MNTSFLARQFYRQRHPHHDIRPRPLLIMIYFVLRILLILLDETRHVCRSFRHGKVDARTEAAWLGHPRQILFDNSTDFEAKMDRVMSAASRLVGLPCRPRKLGKFLLTKPPPPLDEFPVPTEQFEAEKVIHRRPIETTRDRCM